MGTGMKLAGAIGAVVLLVGAVVLAFGGSTSAPDAFAYRDQAVVAEGRALYETHCADCHGAGLEGEPDWRERNAEGFMPAPPHDDTGHTWHHPDRQLFQIVKLGTEAVVGGGYKSNMPGFADTMSDAEIGAVLAYIKSTWPPRIIARHDEMNAAAE